MIKLNIFLLLIVLTAGAKARELKDLMKEYQVHFSYEGQDFNPETWQKNILQKDTENTEVQYTSPDGKLLFKVAYRIYSDYPVVEVRPVLECAGNEATGIVENFESLHLNHPCNSHGIKVRRITGSASAYTDFCHHDVLLQRRHQCDWLHLTSSEGRSSAWLPYIGIDYDSHNGIEMAIGWTGTWRVDMQYAKNFWLTMGLLDKCHFKMLPGECFQMPYTVIYERRDKALDDGLAELHRFMIQHKTPRDARGNIFKPLLPISASGGNKTDANMLKILEFATRNFKDIHFDTFWVDANWYGAHREVPQDPNCGPGWYEWVGHWNVNTWNHPDGNLKKVSDAAHKQGMKFLLWFEPERATDNAPIVKQHPEFFHRSGKNPSPNAYLLDLGNPRARQWVVDEVARNIRESNVDVYRQDFNMDPLPAWRDADAPDRICVSEIKHINGLYAFWDELHRLFPNLMFENCASGGRRMDIEMMSRSHSYCRDDAHMSPDCDELTQNITLNTTSYIPFTGGETFTVPIFDTYAFLSRMGAGTVFTPSDFQQMILRRQPDSKEMEWWNKVWHVADRVRPYFMGDFYALTSNSFDASDIYCGYQLHLADKDSGFFMLFRRKQCAESEYWLKLKSIDADATYEVEEFEGAISQMKGVELSNRILTFSQPRSYKLVFYKKISK